MVKSGSSASKKSPSPNGVTNSWLRPVSLVATRADAPANCSSQQYRLHRQGDLESNKLLRRAMTHRSTKSSPGAMDTHDSQYCGTENGNE